METRLRIGIIGAGAIVRSRHLPGLRAIPGVQITAVANSTEASARAFAEEFCPEARIFSHWQDLAADPELDIVWIGATPHLHECATLAALEAGHHVFCQARMATDLAAAERMLAAAAARPSQVTMLCPPPFGLAEDAFIRRTLAERGPVRQVFLRSWDGAWLDPTQPLHWRQRRDRSGENIMTLGIYAEVLQRWLGPVSHLQAMGKVFIPERGGAVVEVPDALQVNVGFASGVIGQWSFSGIYPGRPRQEVEFHTAEGVLHFDFLTSRLAWENRTGDREVLLPQPGELRPWQVEADFIAAVRQPEAERPEPSFRTGVAYMRVVDAVTRSLTTGSTSTV